ncbi:MAG: peptidase domain-containing ABC transporter [Bacteroides sp.]|nr:peptidase domain-containing ABC transporter [Bacteroides sp.]MCM1447583.1 peptidase domain-containing ABC transporter [Bacteroides sp.]
MFRNSFPHYLQQESADCGPSCLRMIARYYGRTYSAEMLRRRCFISREGVSMLGISDAAESIGFRTVGVQISFKQLVEDAIFPCILHWNQNHFVVCYGVDKRKRSGKTVYKLHISDPATQRITLTREEFEKCWLSSRNSQGETGVALMLEPGPDFGTLDDDFQPAKKGIISFAKYLLPFKSIGLQLVFGLIAGSIIQLIFPFLSQAMVDKGINGRNLNLITLILVAQLSLFLAQLLIGYIRSWIMLHINTRIDISLISDFLIKLMNMPLHFFDTKRTGDILQRIGDHSRIKSFLLSNSMNIVFSIFNFIVFMCILAYYNLMILGIFIVGNTLYLIWVLSFMHYRRELDIKRFYQSSLEHSRLIQMVQGMQDIKLNNCEKQKRWEWERIQMHLFRISVKGLKVGQIQQSGSVLFTQSTNIIISFIAAQSVVDGQMTLGMMMSLTYIIGQISAPIGEFISFVQSLQDARISLERLNEIHAQDDEEKDIDTKLSLLPEEHTICIRNLSFSYSGATRDYAVRNVSLDIPSRKVTAIVGESGCGKTTLLKLIQGFYLPNEGSIKVGGVNLNLINPHLWRKSTGSVMQESFIFSDTIANNIALSTDEVDIARMLHAAQMANIAEFISSLPLGYNTRIGMEGNGISAGQRQRILLARAIYKNPEFMFFDEATNSLDATNERVIMDNLKECYKGKTVIISAHRLSTIKDADQIIVLHHGEVVEQGTHSQLIDARGHYFKLVENQMKTSHK